MANKKLEMQFIFHAFKLVSIFVRRQNVKYDVISFTTESLTHIPSLKEK